jgi:hypothetical protein
MEQGCVQSPDFFIFYGEIILRVLECLVCQV